MANNNKEIIYKTTLTHKV